MADILENLNERQREAVLETEGYVRVIAGAGSGKTKLLVSRYAYLVQDYGIDSSNILCVTFTNKAAGEMKKRIRALIGDHNDTSLICTYHGFCNRLLRENPEKLFLNQQFQIIDAQQQKEILGEIYQKYELKLDYASFESILKKIGAVKKDISYVTRLCRPDPGQILEEIKDQDDKIIEDFLQRQKATYSLDFHDLLSFAIHLLETDPDVREKWQSRLNYIMVDEFQDSSAIEMRLVEILSGIFKNLMIVGDPDQNIYEWRGSDVKLLVDFDREHQPTKTIILNRNYRSTPQILQCANSLIEKNELRLKKDLFTKNAPGAAVIHYHSKNDFEEMDCVIDNIKRLHEKEGLKYSDFAVIYRSGFLSRVAEKKLMEKNIPYEIFGGVRFYQRMEILDILAYLKLIAYDDNTSFRRIVNTPRRRFGRAKMNYLDQLQRGEEEKHSLFSTLSLHLNEREFLNSDMASFVRFIKTMREDCGTKRISDIVNEVTMNSGYEEYIRSLGDEERLDNLTEFKRIANEFEREFGENLSLDQFLQQIALQSGKDAGEAKDTVKLMTIHSSKGLEFPAVFILGFTEGIFPSSKTIGERKKLGLEEERRLCYVAITRAEKYLFLMDSEGTSPNGIKKLVSRFLFEIGEKNYVRVGQISEDLQQESKGYTAKLNSELYVQDTGGKRVGDIVEHHIFGRGPIEKIDEKRGSYAVLFERLGQVRNIFASYFDKEHKDARQNKYEEKEEFSEVFTEKETLQVMDKKRDMQTIRRTENTKGEEFKKEPISQMEIYGEDKEKPIRPARIYGEEEGKEKPEDKKNMENNVKLEKRKDKFKDEKSSETQKRMEEEKEKPGRERSPEKSKAWSELIKTAKTAAAEVEAKVEQELKKAAEMAKAWEKENTVKLAEDQNKPRGTENKNTTVAQDARLKALKENSPNLWKEENVPKTGWICVGISDLGAPVGICEMCGYQIIRYAHHMEHPRYRSLIAGCVCAGKMEGNIAGAKQREAEFKSRKARRINFLKRKWNQSKKGNEYLKIDDHVIVLYHDTNNINNWKYSIDNEFCKNKYRTRDEAVLGAFDALEAIRAKR